MKNTAPLKVWAKRDATYGIRLRIGRLSFPIGLAELKAVCLSAPSSAERYRSVADFLVSSCNTFRDQSGLPGRLSLPSALASASEFAVTPSDILATVSRSPSFSLLPRRRHGWGGRRTKRPSGDAERERDAFLSREWQRAVREAAVANSLMKYLSFVSAWRSAFHRGPDAWPPASYERRFALDVAQLQNSLNC